MEVIPGSHFSELGMDDVVEITLTPGEAIVFVGHLVHAGAAYTTHNIRLHMYVSTRSVVEPDDETYLVDCRRT